MSRRRLRLRTRTHSTTWTRSAVAAAAHAALFIIAFPPIGLWPAALVSLAPLVWLTLRVDRPRSGAGVVWIISTAMWLFMERWLIGVSAVGWPLLAAYLALYPAAFVWIGARLAQRYPKSRFRLSLAFGVLWVGLEFLRGAVALTGYPWFLIAHPLIDTPMAQLAEWVGVYGVSLVVALPQVIVVVALARGRRAYGILWPLVGAASMLVASFALGWFILPDRSAVSGSGTPRSARAFRVAVVQTNVPQSNKTGWTIEQRVKDFARMQELTLNAAKKGEVEPAEDGRDARPTGVQTPDLIVWPETMFPGETLEPSAVEEERRAGLGYEDGTPAWAFNDAILELQHNIGAPMLVGSIGYDGLRISADDAGAIHFDQDGKFNSAFLIDHGAVRPERYDKLHLTPFGEVMPGISWSDRLERMLLSVGASGMAFDLDAGRTPVVFEVPNRAARGAPPERVRIVTPICFEAATPGVCRRLVFAGSRRRADVMINLTNDGWFGSAPGKRAQALQVARWRCIELRTPMVRAANTGISAVIDTSGRVQAAGVEGRSKRQDVDGVLRASVLLPVRGSTLYARIGDGVGWACLVGTGLMAGATLLVGRRGKDTAR